MTFDKTLQDELVRRIRTVVEPLRVLVFGSAARGEMRDDSDVDVLIVVPDGSDRNETARRVYRSLVGLKVPIDVVVATEQDLAQMADNWSLVYRPAVTEGRPIYVR